MYVVTSTTDGLVYWRGEAADQLGAVRAMAREQAVPLFGRLEAAVSPTAWQGEWIVYEIEAGYEKDAAGLRTDDDDRLALIAACAWHVRRNH